jgi:hypothetical protein
MKRQDFLKAVKLARLDNFQPHAYGSEEMGVFSGCALDKVRRCVTFRQVASMILYHCYTFGGTWLDEPLQEIEALSKRWDLIDPDKEAIMLLEDILSIEGSKCLFPKQS